jgi:hypothetical protein
LSVKIVNFIFYLLITNTLANFLKKFENKTQNQNEDNGPRDGHRDTLNFIKLVINGQTAKNLKLLMIRVGLSSAKRLMSIKFLVVSDKLLVQGVK